MDYQIRVLTPEEADIFMRGIWGDPPTEKKVEEKRMSKITVTRERIDHLMDTAQYDVKTVFDKCTIVTAQLENGFILVESSACVDPANYDVKLGEKICKDKIREKLWELEGYALQKALYKLTQEV